MKIDSEELKKTIECYIETRKELITKEPDYLTHEAVLAAYEKVLKRVIELEQEEENKK